MVQSVVQVPVEKTEEVIGLYRNRSRSVDKQPGFLSFQLLQNEVKPGELIVHMTWTNKESYLSWVTSDDFKRIHELEKKYPDQELANIKPIVRRYTVRAD
ncbi:antibiotic biosynthesis monooxygenase family protein [Paenibacillus faecalis]|uniref:antibiotic biosynthesis monooxygenase family protein n=1 Tax=Paenibacillus faecalis TaxID=2079532 RepID=UPI000D0E890B|nr:antibiotic biosynthesis monooxygenase family protein [Paenibacillus faecalis]